MPTQVDSNDLFMEIERAQAAVAVIMTNRQLKLIVKGKTTLEELDSMYLCFKTYMENKAEPFLNRFLVKRRKEKDEGGETVVK